jgi:MFS family permease
VTFISGVPVFFLSIPAGAIAIGSPRKLLMGSGRAARPSGCPGLLYDSHVLTASRPLMSVLLVSGLGLIAGVFSAFMMPAFQSLLPDLVPRKSLMNAIALNSAQFQSSRMIGPMIVSAMVLAGAGMASSASAHELPVRDRRSWRSSRAVRSTPARMGRTTATWARERGRSSGYWRASSTRARTAPSGCCSSPPQC